MSQHDLEPDEERVLSRYRTARAAAFSSMEVVLKADVNDSILVQINTTTKDRPVGLGKQKLREVDHADAT